MPPHRARPPAPFRREGVAQRLAPFVVAACLAIVILLDGGVVPGGMTRGALMSVAFVLGGLLALALLVLWLALHHTRFEMTVGVALSALTFLLPPFSQLMTAELTLGLLYAATNVVIGFSVEMIVRLQREQAGDIEAVEQLLRQIAV